MRRMVSTLLTLAVLAAPAAAPAAPLAELVRKADMVLRGKTSAGVFTMEIKTAAYSRAFTIVVWDDSRGKDRTLLKILGPALWRGNGTLKVGSQLKLYNPAANRVTVVGSSMLGNNWMGSHFTNDDLVKETRMNRHYDKKLIKQWKAGKRTHYLVRLTPRPTAPVAWGKIQMELWEQGPLVIPVSMSYFRKAKAGKPHRVLRFSNIKQLGGRTVPATMTMTVARKPGEFTAITYKSLKFEIKIPDSKFTEQALKH